MPTPRDLRSAKKRSEIVKKEEYEMLVSQS